MNDITIFKTEDEVIINTRIKFIGKDILFYTLPIFIFLKINYVIFVYLFLLTIITYSLFRLFAWMYYSEIIINQKEKSINVLKFKFSNLIDKILISKDYKSENLIFQKIERSGKIKYIISYITHKENELLIVNEKDYLKINNLLISDSVAKLLSN